MTGIFDSGIGGITALQELRKIAPRENIIYLSDRENAPYGTKSADEVRDLAARCASRLLRLGADRVLIACCTAGTAHSELPEDVRELCFPIIEPAARRAANTTKNGKIGVIATNRTAASRAFTREISKISKSISVTEWALQKLVSLVESGARDGTVTDELHATLTKLFAPVSASDIDTLILGCTHFPHLKETIRGILPSVALISPSEAGAAAILPLIKREEEGRTLYL